MLSAQEYRFNFTEARGSSSLTADAMSLSEIRF